MFYRRERIGLLCAALVLMSALFSAQAVAQMTVTGAITGSVKDPSGDAIVAATVTLTNERTGQSRTTTTNEVGAFAFPALQPDTYSLKVEATGFKVFQRTGTVLSANGRLALDDIQLSIGALTETVTVAAQGTTVQTTTAEHSAQLTPDQLQALMARGRDVVSLLRLLPGVQYTADSESVGGNFGTSSSMISGASNNVNILAVDGVVSNDLGSPSVFSSVTTLDAIGEVKVLLNGYQAEYAGNGGAVVEVVTKSGGRDFHGSGYGYKRHEMFNANNFFNNRNKVGKPLYRYSTLGFALGGPVYVPGKFNKNKNLLFFYYNLEQWGIKTPGSLQTVTTPTALERAGNYSQTLDVSGRLIPITDPLSGRPFADNMIPASRISKNGLALLNILPLPNFTNRALSGGNYNYVFQEALEQPKRSQLFRVDLVPTPKDRFYVRGKTWLSEQQGYAVAGGAAAWGLFKQCYCFTESGLSVGYTRVFSPTIVMEFSGGVRHNHEAWYPAGGDAELAKVLRPARGFTAGQLHPEINGLGIIPRFSFGGVPSGADVTFDDRFLTGGADTTFSFNDQVSIIRGPHAFKVGASIYRIREYEGEQSIFSGTFSFARDVNNPLDTNWAYSNALLGNFNSYQEATARYGSNLRQTIAEWFIQDSWKITRRLSLDYGLRFSWFNQFHPRYDGQAALLALERYDPKQAPALYRPALDGGRRVGQNPLTGALVPAVLIGAFVPGSGNPAPGGVLAGDNTYPQGWVNQQPVLFGPRLGFAYDPFGKGKTAIRGAAAILYNIRVSKWSPTSKNPPSTFTPITYYGNIDTFRQATSVLAPSNTNSFQKDAKTPAVYSLTFGVQQDIGFSTVLDVAYAGTFGHDLGQTLNLNTLPYGVRFLPQNADATAGGRPLPDTFLRPMLAYANVNYLANGYTSNYHALQVSANRQFTKGVQLGMAYTWSKMMNYSGIPLYRPIRVWSYGHDPGDQTHIAVFNYIWNLPKASRVAPNPVVHHVLDNWQISGITAFVSGTPSGISLSTTDGADITGGGDGSRVNVTGKAQLPHGERTFDRWFDPTVFARPGRGDPGNAPRDLFRGPGINNWDISLFKKIPMKREDRYLQFRWEMYNAFNHTQYSSVDNGARFDPQGNQVNTRFGQVTAARAARVMQASLRFSF